MKLTIEKRIGVGPRPPRRRGCDRRLTSPPEAGGEAAGQGTNRAGRQTNSNGLRRVRQGDMTLIGAPDAALENQVQDLRTFVSSKDSQ